MTGFHGRFLKNTNLRKFTQIRDFMQEIHSIKPGIFLLTRPATTLYQRGRFFHSYQHYQQGYAQPEEWSLTCCNF